MCVWGGIEGRRGSGRWAARRKRAENAGRQGTRRRARGRRAQEARAGGGCRRRRGGGGGGPLPGARTAPASSAPRPAPRMLPRGRPMHRAACAAEPLQSGARARAEAFGARGAARRAGGAGGAGRGRPPPGARHLCRGRRHGCSRAAPSSRCSRIRRRCAQHARRCGCSPATVRCTVRRARRATPGRRRPAWSGLDRCRLAAERHSETRISVQNALKGL